MGYESNITGERLMQLLERQYIVPTLWAAPGENTLTWNDGGIVTSFEVGDFCRVADSDSDYGYKFYQLYDITAEGNAVWGEGGSGVGDVREIVRITLASNQPQPDASLTGTPVTVTGTDGKVYYSGTWQGETIKAKVTALAEYIVSSGSVDGYATPEEQTFTADIQGDRTVTMSYNACVVTVNLGSNQADNTDISGAKVTLSYGSKSVQLSSGQSTKVPFGASVTVTASEISNYATPSDITFTAGTASKEVTMSYNACVVTVLISGLESMDGVTATVTSNGVSQSVNSGGHVKVPYWKQATVTCPAIEGYAAPGDVTFTPSSPSKSVSMVYAPSALKVTIDSNQTDKTDIAGLKATVSYGGTSIQVSSGQVISIPVGVDVTVSYPTMEGYKKPSDVTFSNSGGLVEKTGTYLTERVTVTVNSDNAASMSGQLLTINGTAYTYAGTPVTVKMPFDTVYSISANDKDMYVTPSEQTFTASQATREVTMQYIYSPIKKGYYIIDDTVNDPATKITNTAEGTEVINWIRANSHRVLARKVSEGKCRVIRLLDTDTTKYLDGTAAPITTFGYDVMMMMPEFWYTGELVEGETDKWKIWFANGDQQDGKTWHKWEHGHLVGAYEAFSSGGMLYSSSGISSTGNLSQETFKSYARARGAGYHLVDWQAHCVMAYLFYGYYSNTDSQAVCGNGTNSYTKSTGATNSLGMADTTMANGNNMSINFWGLENWWGNKYEWIDNIITKSGYKYEVYDVITGAVKRTVQGYNMSEYYPSKMIHGDTLELFGKKSEGSASTGYTDYQYISSATRVVRRSSSKSSAYGGVSFADESFNSSDSDSSFGSRLAFSGEIEEAESVAAFVA